METETQGDVIKFNSEKVDAAINLLNGYNITLLAITIISASTFTALFLLVDGGSLPELDIEHLKTAVTVTGVVIGIGILGSLIQAANLFSLHWEENTCPSLLEKYAANNK